MGKRLGSFLFSNFHSNKRFVSRDPLKYINGMSTFAAYFAPNQLDPYGLQRRSFVFGPFWKRHDTDFGLPIDVEDVSGKDYVYDSTSHCPCRCEKKEYVTRLTVSSASTMFYEGKVVVDVESDDANYVLTADTWALIIGFIPIYGDVYSVLDYLRSRAMDDTVISSADAHFERTGKEYGHFRYRIRRSSLTKQKLLSCAQISSEEECEQAGARARAEHESAVESATQGLRSKYSDKHIDRR